MRVMHPAQAWLGRQPAYVRLQLVAASEAARDLFPALPPGELAVVSDSGDVWIGDRAWIVVLWALREYRGWATKLSSPLLLPMARQAFAAISRNRSAFHAGWDYTGKPNYARTSVRSRFRPAKSETSLNESRREYETHCDSGRQRVRWASFWQAIFTLGEIG